MINVVVSIKSEAKSFSILSEKTIFDHTKICKLSRFSSGRAPNSTFIKSDNFLSTGIPHIPKNANAAWPTFASNTNGILPSTTMLSHHMYHEPSWNSSTHSINLFDFAPILCILLLMADQVEFETHVYRLHVLVWTCAARIDSETS